MGTMTIIAKTLAGAIVIAYIIAIPIALYMACISMNYKKLQHFSWFFRFILAWFLFPVYIVYKTLK